MTDDAVRAAYGARAAEYTELFGDISTTHERDRLRISEWARGVTGSLWDVGCGPGQWTAHLAALVDQPVRGIDLAPEFIDLARRAHPEIDVVVGDAAQLDAPDGSLGGVLAWYSIIHTEPHRLGALFEEFARALRPGGDLLLGFFDGPDGERFDHGVVTAYTWSIVGVEDILVESGFDVVDFETRRDEGRRPHASIAARKT